MAEVDAQYPFSQEDHQVAFIFDPDEGEQAKGAKPRPTKRRRTTTASRRVPESAHDPPEEDDPASAPVFVPLLNGAEPPACVALRQRAFETSWGMIDTRIQSILRESNSATLEEVSAFVTHAGPQCGERIPAAFIVTGPNFASQDLLFEQLSEKLQACAATGSRFVRLRSTDAGNVKAALKKIIRDATSHVLDGDDGGDDDLRGHNGRQYLDYDLEALEASIRSQGCQHVFVGFQDSEAFDSSLLSDLISLFGSWRPRIPFTLLFGIATSVELLQARLLKSACRLVYGAQFDGAQTETILESVFRGAVASSDVPLRLGGALLRGMLDRQRDHVAGIQAFISSLKYVYMCHFYANPLSVLLAPEAGQGNGAVLEAEHYEAMRNLPSVRQSVESAVEAGTRASLEHARSLIESDEYLLAKVQQATSRRRQWVEGQLRSLLIVEAAAAKCAAFSRTYIENMAEAPAPASAMRSGSGSVGSVAESVRQMGAEPLARLLQRVIFVFQDGEPSLHLGPATHDEDVRFLASLDSAAARLAAVRAAADKVGITALRSRYSSRGKVMRTTIIAQRVQLQRDSAALRAEDVSFTEVVDAVASLLAARGAPARDGGAPPLLSESWTYDSKTPLREVMVPRPRGVFERGLARPHDYLSCACCTTTAGDAGGIRATLPATCVLYHLYMEAGSLINVADLWAAFRALVSPSDGARRDGGQQQEEEDEPDAADGGDDDYERHVLALFYRGLAELKALGFVKASRKKTDHIAKVRWL